MFRRTRHHRTVRSTVEPLEHRTLLSSGNVDLTYGIQGVGQATAPLTLGTQEDAILLDNQSVLVSNDVAVARLTPDGLLDTTFATAGQYTLPTDLNGVVAGLALQVDGSILVAVERTLDGDASILRLTADGILDDTWGTAGVLTFDFVPPAPADPAYSVLHSIYVLPDGSILAAGAVEDPDTFLPVLAISKLMPDGSPDVSTTVITTGLDTSRVIAIRPQLGDKILLLENAQSDPNLTGLIFQFNADLTLDTNFDTDGWIRLPDDRVTDSSPGGMEVDADGHFLVSRFNGTDGTIYRYNADGTFDVSFGTAGAARPDPDPNGTTIMYGFTRLEDGRILATRFAPFGLYLFSAEGVFDSTFATAAAFPEPAQGYSGGSRAFELQDGKFLAVGGILSFNGPFNSTNQAVAVRYDGDAILFPEATINAPAEAPENLPIDLSADALVPFGRTVTSYEWDLDYTGVVFIPDLTGQSISIPAFVFDGGTTHTIALQITDSTGEKSTIVTTSIDILRVPPSVTIVAPLTAAENETIALIANVSAAPGRPAVKYLWDIDYNGLYFVPDVSGASPILPAWIFNGPSTHTVAVRVTDTAGDNSPVVTAAIDITNSVPIASITLGTSPAFVGSPVSINLGATDAPGDGVSSWSVDWGDGTVDTVDGTSATASHTYAVFGNYPIAATATDNNGDASSPAELNVLVNAYPQLAGTVFDDANANGQFDSGEAGIPSALLYLDANNNGKLDSGETSTASSTTGYYFFSNIPVDAGQRLRMQSISGYRSTTALGDPLPALPADQTLTLNAGLTSRIDVSGTLFLDKNRNRKLDSKEKGLGGWRVFVDANRNGRYDAGESSVLTDSKGRYSFTFTDAGDYVIRVVPKSQYKFTTPNGAAWSLNLKSGTIVKNRHFGVVKR